MKRSIILEGMDTELVLSKVVEIDTKIETINFEKMKDGTWRLIYSKGTIPDISKLTALRLNRE